MLYTFILEDQSLPSATHTSCVLSHLVGGVVYIFVQQFVIIDLAHNWNDSWVAKADECEKEELGTGQKWLAAILVSCGIMFLGSIVGIILMFVYFKGCTSNLAFISVTLVLVLATTAAQLSGEEGSLLSSALVSSWAVFLLYNAVTKNPNAECNPLLGESDNLSIVMGLFVTIVSLGWTGWSYTAEDKVLFGTSSQHDQDASSPAQDNDKPKEGDAPAIGGHVTGASTYGTSDSRSYAEAPNAAEAAEDDEASVNNDPKKLSNSWRLNVILMAITCWQAVTLTQWGGIVGNGNVANPSVGNVSMWMMIASQWIALALYLWTLVAPRIFTDRDFN
jgi:hypothetical protein